MLKRKAIWLIMIVLFPLLHPLRFARAISNLVPGSTPGSKQRRLGAYLIAIGSIPMAADLLLKSEAFSPLLAYVAVILTVLFFFIVVIGVLFLASHEFQVSPERLASDTLISTIGCILAFAHLYRLHGFSLDATCPTSFDQLDAVYFSSVTFSTLGYGDFRPCEGSRLFAALQAIIGNLHLALAVGAAFLLASTASSRK